MKIINLEFIPVSVLYTYSEVSSLVNSESSYGCHVRATTDIGLVGWGASCSGEDVSRCWAHWEAMAPFVIGRDPWQTSASPGALSPVPQLGRKWTRLRGDRGCSPPAARLSANCRTQPLSYVSSRRTS